MKLTEALATAERRQVLPSALSSAEQRAQLSQEVRNGAVFSARTTSSPYLKAVKESVRKLIDGKETLADGTVVSFSQADARAELLGTLQALNYDSEAGHFGLPEDAEIPPAQRGSLRDLAGEKRLNLVLRTQFDTATAAATHARALDRADTFPAYELVRNRRSRVPRGLRRGKGGILRPDPGNPDWPDRWRQVRGKFYGGRMIALKDDPVWQRLGEEYPDGLGNPHPPFAFNSGMGWEEVGRAECIRLGVIKEDAQTQAQAAGFKFPGMKASEAGLDADTLAALKRDFPGLKQEGGLIAMGNAAAVSETGRRLLVKILLEDRAASRKRRRIRRATSTLSTR